MRIGFFEIYKKQVHKDNIKGVLVDLDGTLVDNFTAIHHCASYCAKSIGLDSPSYEDTVNSVGGSILITMGKLFDEKNALRLAQIFSENFYRFMFDDLKLMPYTVEFLMYLRSQKYKISLFTNKEERAANEILAKIGILQYFNSITGTTLHSHRKPDVEFTNSALQKMGIDASNAIIIGDSFYDYNSAQNLNIKCALVATGTVKRDDLENNAKNALGVYGNFKELAKLYFDAEI